MQCAKGSAVVWLCLPLSGMQEWLLAQPHDIAVRDKCEHACDCIQLGVIHLTASMQACATSLTDSHLAAFHLPVCVLGAFHLTVCRLTV